MDMTQSAMLWYKMLLSDLGSAAHIGIDGPAGRRAKRRVDALIELFFGLSKELELAELMEIGANNAETSRRFVTVSNDKHALAIEASPAVCERTKANSIPDRLNLVNYAIGTKAGNITFYSPNDPYYSVWGSTSKRLGFNDVTEIQVPMITMDQAGEKLFSDPGQRNIAVWADVEGMVLDVLSSGPLLLDNRVALVYLEVNDINAYENSANSVKVIEKLLMHGFIPVARDNEFHDAWNLLALHKSYFDAPRETLLRWMYHEMREITG